MLSVAAPACRTTCYNRDDPQDAGAATSLMLLCCRIGCRKICTGKIRSAKGVGPHHELQQRLQLPAWHVWFNELAVTLKEEYKHPEIAVSELLRSGLPLLSALDDEN